MFVKKFMATNMVIPSYLINNSETLRGVIDLVKSNPNDMDLGKLVRELITKTHTIYTNK